MAVASRSTSPMPAPVVVVAVVEDIVEEEEEAVAMAEEAIAAGVVTVEEVDMVAIKAVVTQVVMVREIS